MQENAGNRLRAALGVGLIHAVLGYALLTGLIGSQPRPVLRTMALFDVPPPVPAPHPIADPPRRHAHAGRAAPSNPPAKPPEILASAPVVPLVVPSPVIAVVKPEPGIGRADGASDRPGTGAGGRGNGDGTDGEGDGGMPPRHIRGRIRNGDYPRALSNAGIGGTVGVRYQVGVDGRATDCRITASSGSAELDDTTCRLIEERFRFAPSRDDAGKAVPSIIVESHSWVIDANAADTSKATGR